jgi:hypothetical protein
MSGRLPSREDIMLALALTTWGPRGAEIIRSDHATHTDGSNFIREHYGRMADAMLDLFRRWDVDE